jgi:exonuclease III
MPPSRIQIAGSPAGPFLRTVLKLIFVCLSVYCCNLQTNMFDNRVLKISSLNCNSLNMSQSARWNQTLKICGVTKLKSDIIFVSDIRVSNKNLVSSENDIRNRCLHNPYEKYTCFFNSSKNKRGVGILIKYDLDYEIIDTRRSEDENLILLHIRIAGTELCLISIYGPNSVDINFFNTIHNLLTNFNNVPAVIGGDFNCTYSTDPVADNIDCLNMSRLPNITHSEKISELCEEFNLTLSVPVH